MTDEQLRKEIERLTLLARNLELENNELKKMIEDLKKGR